MIKKFYTKFLMPLSTDQNVQAREFVLNSLLTGSVFFVSFAFLIILLVSWLVLHHAYVVTYFPALFGSLFFFLTLYAMARKGKYRPAATLLIIGYSVPAVLLVRQWGILVPESIL